MILHKYEAIVFATSFFSRIDTNNIKNCSYKFNDEINTLCAFPFIIALQRKHENDLRIRPNKVTLNISMFQVQRRVLLD